MKNAALLLVTALFLWPGVVTAQQQGPDDNRGRPICGDVNGDGFISAEDVFYLINFLFAGGPAPVCKGDDKEEGRTSKMSDADKDYTKAFVDWALKAEVRRLQEEVRALRSRLGEPE
jgi:Dockerin type I domain